MDFLRAAVAVSQGSDTQKKYLIRETKYTLLAAILFTIFTFPGMNVCIQNLFPGARGPLCFVYKLSLLMIIYYVVQKTEWFQKL